MPGSVWFVGPEHKRTLKPADWVALGTTGTEVTWDSTNGWSIDQSTLSAPQITALGNLTNMQVTGTVGPRPASVVTPDPDRTPTRNEILEMLEAASIMVSYGTAAPTSGAHVRGEKCWNTAPSAAGTPGWVCTAAGTPGTWKAMPNLAA